ncbi:MAG: glycosyltransferase family 4 protein [Fimbriimonadaceae bacterium]|nr:glycosyltransferase family 4 protein [Chitinophagales bacterium]
MNILLIHQYYLEKHDSGGSRWNEMVKVWAENGHRITVLAGMTHYSTGKKHHLFKGKYVYEEEEHKNVRVIRSHVSEKYNTGFAGRLRGYISFVFSSVYAGIFRAKEKYDLIVVSSPPLFVGIAGYFLSRLKRIPYVFEVRDLWPESAIDTGIVKNKLVIKLAFAAEKFIYKKAKLINVLTPAFKESIIAKKNIPAEKIIYIPNAADFNLSEKLLHSFQAQSFRKELGWEDKFVVCYVGAHGVANHLIQVLQTASILKDSNVLFVLIGDGMQKNMLKEKMYNMQLKNVQFIDPVPKEEIFKYILAADVGTSVLMKNDTFKTVYSNKTFDYLSCKKPVLMAIEGVSKKLIEEAQAGLYVEPENPEHFAKQVKAYLNNPQLLSQHGENGYAFVHKYFDREKLAAEYITELEKFIKKKTTVASVQKQKIKNIA